MKLWIVPIVCLLLAHAQCARPRLRRPSLGNLKPVAVVLESENGRPSIAVKVMGGGFEPGPVCFTVGVSVGGEKIGEERVAIHWDDRLAFKEMRLPTTNTGWPAALENGAHTVVTTVDEANEVLESDETDNTLQRTIMITGK